jgi:hypothetical protein
MALNRRVHPTHWCITILSSLVKMMEAKTSHLLEITISNFKTFYDFNIDSLTQINLISGKNNDRCLSFSSKNSNLDRKDNIPRILLYQFSEQ